MNEPMKMGNYTYALATGTAAAKRLALVESVYGPDAERILGRVGVQSGYRVVDFGCGTGSTLPWFSKQVGEYGEVIALDASADQLAIATRNCKSAGLKNIRFVEASAYTTGLPRESVDLAHCRLVLCHLQNPLDALREMAAVVKPGGVVVCFDADIAAIFTIPRTECYERMCAIYLERRRLDGLENAMGLKFPAMMAQVGLVDTEMAFIHPVYLRSEAKRLWEYSFNESEARTLERNLIGRTELDKLKLEVAAVAADESIAIAQARMPVCWARKPA